MRHRRDRIAVGDGQRRGVAQVPHPAVHAAQRRQDARRLEPVLRNELAGELLRARLRRSVAPEAAHHGPVAVEYLQHHRVAGIARQEELDDCARRRIGSERLIGRQRRVGPGTALHAPGRRRAEQYDIAQRRAAELPQSGDVVEDPDRASVRGDDQIVLVDPDIAHRGVRQVQLQRLPVLTVIERCPHGFLGRREQQALALWILADGIHGGIRRQACGDGLPGPARVAGAVHVRAQVVDAHAAHGYVGGVDIEMRRLDLRHLAPGRQRGRRDVRPARSVIARHPDKPVIRAGPQRGGCEG